QPSARDATRPADATLSNRNGTRRSGHRSLGWIFALVGLGVCLVLGLGAGVGFLIGRNGMEQPHTAHVPKDDARPPDEDQGPASDRTVEVPSEKTAVSIAQSSHS